jgi:hypothetical protein
MLVEPKATRTPGRSPAPVIVIDAPPPVDPSEGVTDRMVGAGFVIVGGGFVTTPVEGAVGVASPHPTATPPTARRLAASHPVCVMFAMVLPSTEEAGKSRENVNASDKPSRLLGS